MSAQQAPFKDTLTFRWATLAQYTKGTQIERSYDSEEEALTAFEFLTTRASTDWVELYQVVTTESWTMLNREERS